MLGLNAHDGSSHLREVRQSIATQSGVIQDVVTAAYTSPTGHIGESPDGGQVGSNECVLQGFQGSDERRCLSVRSQQIIKGARREVEGLHGTCARSWNIQQRAKQSGVRELLSQCRANIAYVVGISRAAGIQGGSSGSGKSG